MRNPIWFLPFFIVIPAKAGIQSAFPQKPAFVVFLQGHMINPTIIFQACDFSLDFPFFMGYSRLMLMVSVQ
jgi:hypothetical protein